MQASSSVMVPTSMSFTVLELNIRNPWIMVISGLLSLMPCLYFLSFSYYRNVFVVATCWEEDREIFFKMCRVIHQWQVFCSEYNWLTRIEVSYSGIHILHWPLKCTQHTWLLCRWGLSHSDWVKSTLIRQSGNKTISCNINEQSFLSVSLNRKSAIVLQLRT